MSLKTLTDFIFLVDELVLLARNFGVSFDSRGFPIFKREWFLEQVPDLLIPYSKRHTKFVHDPKRTALCHYSPDREIYPRLCCLTNDLPEYLCFLGVVMSDITVTLDMDREWQDFIMLANLLYAAILGANGVKIIPNLRIGDKVNIENLSCIPHKVIWAAGFLGCEKDKPWDMQFIYSVVSVGASFILIFGKHDANAEDKLQVLNIPYKVYPDYHKLCKGGK